MSFSTWHCHRFLVTNTFVSLVVRCQLTLLCARLTLHMMRGSNGDIHTDQNAFLRVSSSIQTRTAAVKQGVCSSEIRKNMIAVPQLQSQRGCSSQKDKTRERDVTYRHCRASLLENEIGHIDKVWGHSRVKRRFVPHRTERCKRVLLTNVIYGCDLTIRKVQKDDLAFREAGVGPGVRTQQLPEEVACACACTKNPTKKTAR